MDTVVVCRFLLGSVLLVVAVIALAWLFSLLLVRFRRRRHSFLDDIEIDDERDRND
ncbi:MAG: hypothetical protein HUJ31_03015 [Pseudomonadales bacterium]|nr:hypothetical protein [Pseudomonadales bacterium]